MNQRGPVDEEDNRVDKEDVGNELSTSCELGVTGPTNRSQAREVFSGLTVLRLG